MRVVMIHGIGDDADCVTLEQLEQVITTHPKLLYTFDDGLKSQELAFPLLAKYKIRGIFFVNNENKMIAHKRTVKEKGIKWVWDQIGQVWVAPPEFLAEYDFYSQEERDYRHFRDYGDPARHDFIMDYYNEPVEFLDPAVIVGAGHILGLHSATHPRTLDKMLPHQQMNEWVLNMAYIREYQADIKYASYPMGRYNAVTKEIMKLLGIKLAFSSSEHSAGELSYPRSDIKSLI